MCSYIIALDLDNCVYLVVFEKEKESKSEIEDFVFCLFLYIRKLIQIDFTIYLFNLYIIVDIKYI